MCVCWYIGISFRLSLTIKNIDTSQYTHTPTCMYILCIIKLNGRLIVF